MIRNRYQALSQVEKRTFWVALGAAIIFAIFAITLISDFISATTFRTKYVNVLPLIVSCILFAGAGLILTGRSVMGSWFMQIGALIVLTFAVTQSDGIGFSSAFMVLAITVYIPVQILKGRMGAASLWTGVLGAAGIITLDIFWKGGRIYVDPSDALVASILTITLSLILISTTIIQFNTYAIRTKLLIFSLGTGLVSILSVAIFTSLSIRQTLTLQTNENLASAAKQSMGEIDTYITYNINTISAEAQNPQIVSSLKSSLGEQRLHQAEMVALLNSFIQRDPEHIVSYNLIYRVGGQVVADTIEFNIGFAESDRDYFIIPRFSGNAYVSPVRYSPTSPDHEFFIGVPVLDEDGKFLGVLSARFRSSVLNQITASNNDLVGQGSYSILLDEYNLILAHGTNQDWVSHTLVTPGADTFDIFQKEHRILRNIGGANISLNMPDFSEKLQALSKDTPYFSSTDDAWGDPVQVGVAASSTAPLRLAYVQPQSIAFAAINQQEQVTVVVALVTGMMLLLIGFYVARVITRPIITLASVAEDISTGNLSARAQFNVNDEIGTLAKTFNRMTSQLQDTLGGLERRVAERTSDAEMARLLSDRRAQELLSISEISKIISTEQRQDVLLPLITRIVSERFDFYHVGIFLIDNSYKYAILQAANSEGGQRMLQRGHRLEVGQTGIVGDVASLGKPRIALDVGTDAVFFNNPDLPDTRSEMGLPLFSAGQVIGVLDVQSVNAGAFTESDVNTLSILADQVATAIQNARLFGQIQQARDEAEALYNQYIKTDWATFAKQETNIGYHQSLGGGKLLETPVQSKEIQTALQKGEVVVMYGKNNDTQPTIAVPVKLRGQTIGVLNIKAPTNDRKWNNDEIKLAQAISDRLALALDNARLLQESQRNAAKEAKIGEVTAKIGASINMRNVLQTAVEELGLAMPGSDVTIQFKIDDQ